jgi:hypothetical protein
MSYSNASRRAPAHEDVPAPSVSDLRFEMSLRRANKNFTVSVDRRTGERCLGVLFPAEVGADEWEGSLDALTREQGLVDGRSLETQQQTRGRQDEPTADPATTTRTLARRG